MGKRHLLMLNAPISELRGEADDGAAARKKAREEVAGLVRRIGLQAAAAHLQSDPSNLLKVVKGLRGPSENLLARLAHPSATRSQQQSASRCA